MTNSASAAPPRFDSNRAWQDASAAVAANRDVLAALAGVFVVLPAFALTVLLPMPEPQAGADFDAILKGTQAYFAENWPWYLLAGLINVVGTMALLALFGQSSRPTVSEAIRTGLSAAPSGIGVQVMQGFLLSGIVLAPATILGLSGSPGLTALGALIGVGLAAWFWGRTSLATPAIIVQGIRNPVAALQRSFALTKGNAGRLLLFFFLLVLAFVIVTQLVTVVIGLIAQALAGAEASALISGFVASVFQGAMSVYMAGAVTMSHRQLVGTASPDVPGTFG